MNTLKAPPRYVRRTKKNLFYLVSSFMLILQYQNCAGPVNQSASSGDPRYIAQPITGGVSDAPVSSNNGASSKIFFAMTNIELSNQSAVLRPGGVCAQTSQVSWALADQAVSSLILMQGAASCDRGTFHVDLSSAIPHLECEKVYQLSAALADGSPTQMSIVRHCGALATNN
jgi:hypothetical protein